MDKIGFTSFGPYMCSYGHDMIGIYIMVCRGRIFSPPSSTPNIGLLTKTVKAVTRLTF